MMIKNQDQEIRDIIDKILR